MKHSSNWWFIQLKNFSVFVCLDNLERFCYLHCVCFDGETGWIYTFHIDRISRIDSVWSEWVNWFRNTWDVIDKTNCLLIIVVIAYLKASLCAAKLVVEYQRIGCLSEHWIMSTVILGHTAIWSFSASVKFIWSGKNLAIFFIRLGKSWFYDKTVILGRIFISELQIIK